MRKINDEKFIKKLADRTLQVAHKYISGSWTKLEDGAVVDVEFILLEVDKPKKSQFDEKGPYADY